MKTFLEGICMVTAAILTASDFLLVIALMGWAFSKLLHSLP